MTSDGAVPEAARLQPVSPELVLIDPVLAEHARARLPDPDDTLLRIERIIRANRRFVAGAERTTLADFERASGSVDSPSTAHPQQAKAHKRSVVLAGAAAVGVLIASVLAGVRVDLHGDPAGADATVRQPPVISREASTVGTATQASSRRTSGQKSRRDSEADRATGVAGPRRFAWVPVAGASGYHVELFRGESLVFSAETERPQVSIPPSWMLAGRRMTLRPGEYRWYVWTLRSGVRASSATVQARLVVPPGNDVEPHRTAR